MDRKTLCRALVLGVLVVGSGAIGTPTAVMAGGGCTTATIDEPFLLPDGKIHAPGQLKICLERRYSPVASLHETRVDGMRIGMFITRHQQIESGDQQQAFLVFARDRHDQLCLLGYTRPGAEGARFFAFDHPSVQVEIGEFRLAARPGAPLILVPAWA